MSLADVTSANVVGYSNYPLNNGATLAGAAFNIIAEEGSSLLQIVPQGYETSSAFVGSRKSGCKGAIIIQVLDKDGKISTDKDGLEMEYKWYHTWSSKDGWANDGHWQQGNTTITAANDISFANGQGLWIKVSTGWIEGMSFSNAGEALLDSQTVPLNNGATLVVVPVSKTITLEKFIPGGYETSSAFVGSRKSGCKGAIIVQFLDKDGKIATDGDGLEMEYKWYHTWSSKDGWANDGHWQQGNTTITTANAPTVKMGQGLWVKVSTGWVSGMFVQGPGVDD